MLHTAIHAGAVELAGDILVSGGCRFAIQAVGHGDWLTPLALARLKGSADMLKLFSSGVDYWQRLLHRRHSWAMRRVVFLLLLTHQRSTTAACRSEVFEPNGNGRSSRLLSPRLASPRRMHCGPSTPRCMGAYARGAAQRIKNNTCLNPLPSVNNVLPSVNCSGAEPILPVEMWLAVCKFLRSADFCGSDRCDQSDAPPAHAPAPVTARASSQPAPGAGYTPVHWKMAHDPNGRGRYWWSTATKEVSCSATNRFTHQPFSMLCYPDSPCACKERALRSTRTRMA